MDFNLETEMYIIITPKALEFLKRNNTKNLYIQSVNINQCCIPVIAPPEVHKGVPRQPDKFRLKEMDGLTIYYDKGLPLKPKITIDVQGFGFIKALKIIDWEIRF
ncbi:MAG: CC/Se motif family (seleno)protein [Desulfitobacterium hafniense]|nr:CC/Se motif family (seleno)protein [Desulfitobacterium hafniense]